MSDHGTASVSGAYIEFQAAVLKALPRDIDDAAALGWANSGQALTGYLAGLRSGVVEKTEESAILRLISGGEKLVLDETDGSETISTSEGIFAYVDPDFRGYGADEVSGPTPKTPVAVHELVQDAMFAQMFGGNPGALCLTQSQILNFIKKYRSWLRTDGYATFFLFRSRGELFVASVYFRGRGELRARVYRFGGGVWRAGCRRRLVLPQL